MEMSDFGDVCSANNSGSVTVTGSIPYPTPLKGPLTVSSVKEQRAKLEAAIVAQQNSSITRAATMAAESIAEDAAYEDEDEEDSLRNSFEVDSEDLAVKHNKRIYDRSMSFQGIEVSIIRYCLTKIVNQYMPDGEVLAFGNNTAQCVTQQIQTAYKSYSNLYGDLSAHCTIRGSTVYVTSWLNTDNGVLRVMMSSTSKKSCDTLMNKLLNSIEANNFYRGKALRIEDGVTFIKPIDMIKENCVLDEKIKDELNMNIVSFLSDEKMHAIVKKRGVLLYGPPGTGKTTSVKYVFSELAKNNVTCLFLTETSLLNRTVEQLFYMIKKYLAPCVIVMEDVDLFLADRTIKDSPLLGTMLSIMNGIEEDTKPIVFMCTTNRVDVLDNAITRPCRLDRKIKIDYPSEENLAKIFENISGLKMDISIFKQGESRDKKLTGAHVQEIYNTAVLLSQTHGKELKDCVVDAVTIVKENFFIGMNESSMLFKNDSKNAR